MIHILSNDGNIDVIDCSKEGNNGESPITYGDIYTD